MTDETRRDSQDTTGWVTRRLREPGFLASDSVTESDSALDSAVDSPLDSPFRAALEPGPRVPDPAPTRDASAGAAALGSDPFAEVVEEDPFVRGLQALGAAAPARPPAAHSEAHSEARPEARPEARREDPAPAERLRSVLGRVQRELGEELSGQDGMAERSAAKAVGEPTPFARPRPWSSTPSLAEVDLPETVGWIERLLDPEDRRRIAALAHLVEGEASYDRFGLSPDVLRRTFPAFYALYKLYFRVFSEGHDNIPAEGPGILACNHAGLLPFDGSMIVVDAVLNTDPPRLPRAIVDFWAGTLPWVNIFFARVGQVIGTRENFADLLGDGQLMLVFPEGMAGVRKPVTQRYRLQHFHVGFVEQALLASAPIIPMAVIGSDDQSPILFDIEPIAKRLGLPSLPITPTFPWFGPLGLLPYPVGYHIVYGEPLDFHERFGPDDAKDAKLVAYLAKRVRREVQHLMDKNR